MNQEWSKGMSTNSEYWDCECEHDYIVKKSDRGYCALCDSYEKDCPDSMNKEVEIFLTQLKNKW